MPTEKDLSGYYKIKTGAVDKDGKRHKAGAVVRLSSEDAKSMLETKTAEACEAPVVLAAAASVAGTYTTKTSLVLTVDGVAKRFPPRSEVTLSHEDATAALAAGTVEVVAKASEPVKPEEPKGETSSSTDGGKKDGGGKK